MADTLYDKYGGFPTVSALVVRFYDRVVASPSLAPYFAQADMPQLIDHQTQFLCMVLGGPNNYQGRGLRTAHARMNITEGAFAEVAGHLKDTLEEGGVAAEDVAAILGVVASAKSDVLGT